MEVIVRLSRVAIFFWIALLGSWQGPSRSAMRSSLGGSVGGGPREEQDCEKTKLDRVSQSQDSSRELTRRLAGLLQALEATTAAVERGREAWAAAVAAPTEPQQVRYRRCRGGVSAHHAMMAGAAGEGAHWNQDPSVAKQIWCKSRVLPRCRQICKWQVAGKQ